MRVLRQATVGVGVFFLACFDEKEVFRKRVLVGPKSQAVFCWLALAKRQFSGYVSWLELNRNLLVARFDETALLRRRAWVGAKPLCFIASLWRAGTFRKAWVGERKIAVFF